MRRYYALCCALNSELLYYHFAVKGGGALVQLYFKDALRALLKAEKVDAISS